MKLARRPLVLKRAGSANAVYVLRQVLSEWSGVK